MKKKLLLILMFMTMFIVGNKSANALECKVGEAGCTVDAIKKEINSETKQLACVYIVRVESKDRYYSYIYYDITNDNFYASSTFKDRSERLQNNDNAYLLGDAYDELYENNSCPSYAYLDKLNFKEMCFDNDKECVNDGKMLDVGTNFNFTLGSNIEYDNLKNIGNSTESSCRYENVQGDYIDYNPNDNTMYVFLVENGKKYFVGNSNSEYSEHVSMVMKKYTFNNNIKKTNKCLDDLYLLKKKSGVTHIQFDYHFYDSKNSSDFKEKFNDEYDLIEFYCTTCKGGTSSDTGPTDGCEIISSSLRKTINDIMKIIRIAIPLLLIGLITYDFATAVFTGDEKSVNKAKGNAIKRIIIAVVIFFVPTLINLVFDLANEVWSNANYEICGLDE